GLLGRLGMTQKTDSFAEYPARSLEVAQCTLITAWESLGNYWDDLVVVGGLAVHYSLSPEKLRAANLPGAVTLDVDFGISLGASAGMYGMILSDLSGLGFKQEDERLVKMVQGRSLYIDFLTEDAGLRGSGRQIDGITASLCPGIGRALQKRRWVEVEGKDVYGSQRTLKVPIADIGPLLVLKLNAFEGRKHPKDAYDVLLAVTAWHEGAEAAVAAFQAKETAGNRGFSRAKRAVEEHFVSLDQLAPTRAMQFLYEDSPASGSQGRKVMEDLVTIGQALLGR
ncbi:MAG: hypothetical protein WBL39_16675, partial [Terrimicrobiaceae bacterium]